MDSQNQTYAGFADRFIALIIDSFIAPILITVVLALISFLIGETVRHWMSLHHGFPIIYSAGWFLYFALQESSARQATFGKRAMGIRVVDLDGRRISFGRAALRTLLKIVSGMCLLFGYLMAAFTKKNQAFHDLMSGCVVIPEPRTIRPNGPTTIPQNNKAPSSKIWPLLLASIFILMMAVGGYLKWVWWPHFKRTTMPKIMSGNSFINGSLAEVLPTDLTLPVLASESDYEHFLQSGPVVPENPTAIAVGPAFLKIDHFWPGVNNGPTHVWVTVKMSAVPNVNHRVLLAIRHVWTANHSDVYDASSWQETEFSQRLSLTPDFGSKEILNATRDVQLISGTKENEIQSLEGELVFNLPLDIAKLEWDATGIGKELDTQGIKIRLTSLDDHKAVFEYTGSLENRVKVAGFDQAGQLLTNKEEAKIIVGHNGSTTLTYTFQGIPKKIWFYVASRFFKKQYTFVLNKP
jgi:uncharacterized RDD family membrane protein YckC